MEIKPGYKSTEVGCIPEDWDVVPMASITGSAIQNGVFNEPSRKGRGCKLINVIDLYNSVPIETAQLERFDATKDELSKFGVGPGDIFFTRSSLTPDGIAHCNVYGRGLNEDVVFDCHIIRVRPNQKIVDPFFLTRYCTSKSARCYLTANAKTTTMTTIDQAVIAKMPIPLPPLSEQRAIAEVLSDVDTLLDGLTRLIAKKRDLKQAAMQQLLTGQTRLPGFHCNWGLKPLRYFARQFIVPMRDKPRCLAGDIPWCRIEDFDGMLLEGSKSGQGVDAETIKSMNLKVYPVGTLLVSCSADLGRCAVVGTPLVSNQTFIGIELEEQVASNVFFYYLMSSKSEELNNLSSGTTISYLSREQFEEFKVLAPLDKAEQTAIATVLSDMDAELAGLEARLTKTRALKQAMMSELLTGKTRLPI